MHYHNVYIYNISSVIYYCKRIINDRCHMHFQYKMEEKTLKCAYGGSFHNVHVYWWNLLNVS